MFSQFNNLESTTESENCHKIDVAKNRFSVKRRKSVVERSKMDYDIKWLNQVNRKARDCFIQIRKRTRSDRL